jgi:hypothetical protein
MAGGLLKNARAASKRPTLLQLRARLRGRTAVVLVMSPAKAVRAERERH